MKIISGYKFNIYYDTSLIHEDDDVYEEEEEALSAGRDYVLDRVEQYKDDGAWNENDSEELFDVVIVDVEEIEP